MDSICEAGTRLNRCLPVSGTVLQANRNAAKAMAPRGAVNFDSMLILAERDRAPKPNCNLSRRYRMHNGLKKTASVRQVFSARLKKMAAANRFHFF